MRLYIIVLTILFSIFQTVFGADYYKATSNLNVRTGAGKEYPISFKLKKGDLVMLLSKKSDWYNIEYLNHTGYARAKYLEFNKNIPELQPNSNLDREVFFPFLITIFIVLSIFIAFANYRNIINNKLLNTVTDKNRGTESERDLVLSLLKSGVPSQYIFHDLYLEKRESEFSQTDLVLFTKVGILVFEIKDYSGWIFGSGHQTKWTKVLAYGRQKYYFYNPIKQNNAHIKELKRKLSPTGNVPFFSIIVFYGDCVLKDISFVPIGTYIVKSQRVLEVVAQILSENNTFFFPNENEVIRILREAVANGGYIKNQIIHNQNIQDMLGTKRVFD
jgi:hypothetical protein